MSGLPNGWSSSNILGVLQNLPDGRLLHQGWSPQCEKEASKDDQTWGVLKTTAIQSGEFLPEFNKALPNSLSPRVGLEVQTGDILITCAGPRVRCGVPCLVRRTRSKLILSGKMYRMRANERVMNPSWLETVLRSPLIQKSIETMKTGGSDSGLNLTHERFSKLVIPVPPLLEQHRIVAKIEALMARSRKAREALEQIPALLERYRQSVIHAAITGELSKEWRSSNPNKPWEHLGLGQVLSEKPRNGYSPQSVDYETPVKSLSLSATTSGIFKPEYSKFIDEEIPTGSHLWLKPGDILIQRANTYELVGVSAIFDGPPETFIYPDLMMKCRANRKVSPDFLHLALSSWGIRSYFRANATGTAGNMPKINQGTVVSAPIQLPSIEEQNVIVNRTKTLLGGLRQMEAMFDSVGNQIDFLDQSILAKAFRGELVPQDPADEPAEALLARIRAEREQAGAPSSKRGRGKAPVRPKRTR